MEICAGAFLVRDGFVLLGLRSPNRSAYPSVWDCIGGHAIPAESPREALFRELAEEIQVTPIEFHELATLPELEPRIHGAAAYHIFVVTNWTGKGPIATGDEHSEIRWFPIAEALELNLAHPGYVELLKQL
jgi:8-oxo-dGTP pyrophosphatase MutT (NUDIX family)